MTQTIAETRVRAQVQEYDGVHYVYIECREGSAWEPIAHFEDACCEEHALNQAREAGWAWLVGREDHACIAVVIGDYPPFCSVCGEEVSK